MWNSLKLKWRPEIVFTSHTNGAYLFQMLLCQEDCTGSGYFLKDKKTQCPQIYINLTQFEDNDGRKLPLKFTCLGAVGFEK